MHTLRRRNAGFPTIDGPGIDAVTDRHDNLRRQPGSRGPEEFDDKPDATHAGPSSPPMQPLASPPDLDQAPPPNTAPPAPPLDPALPPLPPEPRSVGGGERPPGGSRDPRPAPAGQTESTPRAQQRDRQPPRAPTPRQPADQPQYGGGPQSPGPPTEPNDRTATPPAPLDWSYTDRIRVNDLVPQRRIPPARGWRRLLYRATSGLINPGQSSDERRQAELEAKIKGILRGHFKIGVMGKGGVGKTTVSACLGSVFAEVRSDDRVVAIDADTGFGKLGSRIDPKAVKSHWELAADQHLDTFADIRSFVGNNSASLFVLAGESSPRWRMLDPGTYREAASRLDRYFTITVVDCSSTIGAPVTREVLRDLNALVVVSSPWVDAAAAAGQTMDWLANHGLTELLQRTVIVLNDSDGHADKRTRSILAQQFSSHGQTVIELPFDSHLRPGGVIDSISDMAPPTRRRFLEIAAALAEYFPTDARV